MRKFLFTLCLLVSATCASFAQADNSALFVDFSLQSDGSFRNVADGKSYVVIEYPGMTQQELYHNFLIVLQNRCVSSDTQYSCVENRSINVYEYECEISVGNGWTFTFDGCLYSQILFQFKDGKVRIDAPYMGRVGWRTDRYRMKFTDFLKAASMFEKDGSINPKREKYVKEINRAINEGLTDIVNIVKTVDKW